MAKIPDINQVPDAPARDNGEQSFVDLPGAQLADFHAFLRSQVTSGISAPTTVNDNVPPPSHDPRDSLSALTPNDLRDVDMTLEGMTEAELAQCVVDAPVVLSDDDNTAFPKDLTLQDIPYKKPVFVGPRPRPITVADLQKEDPDYSLPLPPVPQTPKRRTRAASLLAPNTPKVVVPTVRAGSVALEDAARGTAAPALPPAASTPSATGRLNAAEEAILSEAATRIYAEIHELAFELNRKPDLIINRINALTGSKMATKKSLWNYYQSYFARNKEVEHARIGTQEPTKREYRLAMGRFIPYSLALSSKHSAPQRLHLPFLRQRGAQVGRVSHPRIRSPSSECAKHRWRARTNLPRTLWERYFVGMSLAPSRTCDVSDIYSASLIATRRNITFRHSWSCVAPASTKTRLTGRSMPPGPCPTSWKSDSSCRRTTSLATPRPTRSESYDADVVYVS